MEIKERKIVLTLTQSDEGKYGFTIFVGERLAVDGSGYANAEIAYQKAIDQLEYHAECFPIDCPDPFMPEDEFDDWLEEEINAGRRK